MNKVKSTSLPENCGRVDVKAVGHFMSTITVDNSPLWLIQAVGHFMSLITVDNSPLWLIQLIACELTALPKLLNQSGGPTDLKSDLIHSTISILRSQIARELFVFKRGMGSHWLECL